MFPSSPAVGGIGNRLRHRRGAAGRSNSNSNRLFVILGSSIVSIGVLLYLNAVRTLVSTSSSGEGDGHGGGHFPGGMIGSRGMLHRGGEHHRRTTRGERGDGADHHGHAFGIGGHRKAAVGGLDDELAEAEGGADVALHHHPHFLRGAEEEEDVDDAIVDDDANNKAMHWNKKKKHHHSHGGHHDNAKGDSNVVLTPTPAWWFEDEHDDWYDRTYLTPDDISTNRYHQLRTDNRVKNHFAQMCGHYRFNETLMPTVSVIITTQNEPDKWLSITIHSIFARTPPALLKQVIVVDDNGSTPEERENVDEDEYTDLTTNLDPLKFHLIHNAKREGCARSRLAGARYATGDVLMFVDSHIEMMSATWYQHLVIPILENPHTVSMQTIDVIDDRGKKNYNTGSGSLQYGVVNDEFWFSYQTNRFKQWAENEVETPGTREPYETPFGPGSLFAIRRDEFWRVGGYDEGLYVWGGENTELAFKMWMCGGRMVMVPCSRVGHMYRMHIKETGRWPPKLDRNMTDKYCALKNPDGSKAKYIVKNHPADNFTRITTRNNLRIMNLWVGDHPAKKAYYKRMFGSEVLAPEFQWMVDEAHTDPYWLKQQRIRKQNQCRDFEWWDKYVFRRLTGKHHPWHPSEQKSKQVDCGSHKSNACQNCPMGHGKSWCNGECGWCDFHEICLPLNSLSKACPPGTRKRTRAELKRDGGGDNEGEEDDEEGKKKETVDATQKGRHNHVGAAAGRAAFEMKKREAHMKKLEDSGRLHHRHQRGAAAAAEEEEGEEGEREGRHNDADAEKAADIVRPRAPANLPNVTLSVVLPCGFEHEYFVRTAKSVFAATPDTVLKEIIIVDDASDPPLEPMFPAEEAKEYKVKYRRLDKAAGLIGAKHAGAEVATGDALVFFDCHVKPDPQYWLPFVTNIAENYRRVVVPTITALNTDTWTEMGRPAAGGTGMSKCYLTFDGEFKWTTDETPYVPIMSGGLLAMSRKWFFEVGGYDTAMKGWGGENLDQSLRIWLCGGEIVSAADSYVAHMWRDGKHRAKYHVPPGAGPRNRARAMKAHVGPWFDKTLSFHQFKAYRPGAKEDADVALDVDSITGTMKGLDCKSFEWYLRKFKYIYRDAGLLPTEIFQIEAVAVEDEEDPLEGERHSCLQLKGHPEWGNAFQPSDRLTIQSCVDKGDEEPTEGVGSTQWFHRSNRRKDDTCCSGLRIWNTDQCLDGGIKTSVCNLEAGTPAELKDDGTLRVTKGMQEECISVDTDGQLEATSCDNASKWRKRGAFEPIEYRLLSEEAKQEWNE